MKIGQIQKTSLIDYPGKISAIIFTKEEVAGLKMHLDMLVKFCIIR